MELSLLRGSQLCCGWGGLFVLQEKVDFDIICIYFILLSVYSISAAVSGKIHCNSS